MYWNDLIEEGIKLVDCLKAFSYPCFLLQTLGGIRNGCKKIDAQNLLDIQNQASTRLSVNHYSLVTVLRSSPYPDEGFCLRISLS